MTYEKALGILDERVREAARCKETCDCLSILLKACPLCRACETLGDAKTCSSCPAHLISRGRQTACSEAQSAKGKLVRDQITKEQCLNIWSRLLEKCREVL